ncbi:hypothetical protein G1H11_18800 [Phytoactinopolyspora alkaliphila]|uniref:Uncharacterized protein n=1 Tax=Phytoactinopolyspora alkaliphila TaxID=1783498 RepID=A0A6N9YQZ5_9ACTN|nr:hypothetical protein [Phytoactinopolyspora alkaliphila]NED97350.1 hypothetical protein [Phytoactinopolyspora alkaliphila]
MVRDTRHLDGSGGERDPQSEPLTYPGRPVPGTGVILGDAFHQVNAAELDGLLRVEGGVPLSERTPVLAVGSNASPAQLRRKLPAQPPRRLVLPITAVDVGNLAPGVSAHVSRPGYVPATPVAAPGETSRLVVVWLDTSQLRAMDATEPNYDRTALPADRFPVRHETGAPSACSCEVYVSHHGCLTDRSGAVRRLEPQSVLIQSLLAGSPALRELAGETPESFVCVMRRDPSARQKARRLFITEGRVSLFS